MQATVSRISPGVIELSVEVPADAVRTEIDKAYLTLAKKAHIRGFRPGKAPREVLTRLFGSQVVGDVMMDANVRLAPLAARCAELERWEFLFTMAPLRIPKGTGCPVNPVAVL